MTAHTGAGSESAVDSPYAQALARQVDAGGVYFSPTLQQRVDLIEHLIEFGRQIIVLNGVADSGKTTLLDHLAGAQRTHWRTVRVTAGPGLSATGLLGQIATELDLDVDPEDVAALLVRLRQRIAALEKAGRIVVLLVDDADQLVPEVPPAIVQLAHTDDQIAELRVLLAADLDRSVLLEVLQRARPQHGLVHVVEIPRLAEGQVKALIEQRLRAGGLQTEGCFDDVDYARITAAADGLVGKVVTLARQHAAGIAVAPMRPGARRASVRAPSRLVFGLLAAGAVALGAWWATHNPLLPEEAPDARSEQIELAPPALEAQELPSVAAPLASTISTPAAAVSAAEGARPKVQAPASTAVPPTANAPAAPDPAARSDARPASPTASAAPSNPAVAASAPATPLSPANAPAVAARTDSDAPGPPPFAPPAAVESAAPAVTPGNTGPPPVAESAGNARPTSTRAASAPVAAKAATPSAPVASKPISAPTAVTPVIANFSGDWLLQQDATAHTLQLFGVRARAAAETYRRQRGIITQSAVLTATLDGDPWYIVVYGFYPTRGGALAAMARLPQGLRDAKPWARSVGSLRDALR
jgi:DamX protein